MRPARGGERMVESSRPPEIKDWGYHRGGECPTGVNTKNETWNRLRANRDEHDPKRTMGITRDIGSRRTCKWTSMVRFVSVHRYTVVHLSLGPFALRSGEMVYFLYF